MDTVALTLTILILTYLAAGQSQYQYQYQYPHGQPPQSYSPNNPNPFYSSHAPKYHYRPPPPSPYYDEREGEGEYDKDDDDDDHYYSYRHRLLADEKFNYILEWDIDIRAGIIVFNLTIESYGWVGIGLGKTNCMDGADLVIGGVREDGLPYLMDMYGDYSNNVYQDPSQDWTLRYAYERNGITILSISRPLETCDDYDYPITEDLVYLLWAFGETDYLEYHFDKRGSFRMYFLDPVVKIDEDERPLQFWRVSKETKTRPIPTSYWCTIHRAPILTKKHHMIEINGFLANQLAVNHVHHIVLWLCVAPPGLATDVIFEPFTNYEGEECYFNDAHLIPVNLCKLLVGGWAIGGLPFKLPYSTGIPIGESPAEYYMLEIHYNNPEMLELEINSGLDILFTEKLRKHDGSFQFIGHDVLGLFIAPPVSEYYQVFGMCTPNCTKTMFPDGVEIVSVLLHGHTSARALKLHHFRNYTELPWIKKDDNYDNTYQQGQVLYKPRKVLPGDELVVRCTLDTTWTNLTVVSGFSTINEMCLAIVVINERIPFFGCFGQVPGKDFLPYIGVEKYKWDTDTQSRKVTAPPKLAGQFLSYVTDNLTDWTKWLRYKYQEIFLSSTQVGSCPEVLAPTSVDQVLHGNIMSETAEIGQMVELAKTFGDEVLMGGPVGLPNRTPGPRSWTKYPTDLRRAYQQYNYCPKPYSPF